MHVIACENTTTTRCMNPFSKSACGCNLRMPNIDSRTNVYHECHHTIHACIVESSCIENTIRLADSDSYNTGRVDLCYNQSWTTLYDASITPEVATVACRQLGFSDTGIIIVIVP